jgi:hypothetical protein
MNVKQIWEFFREFKAGQYFLVIAIFVALPWAIK